MKAQVVSFHCILKSKTGRVLSSTFNHDVLTSIEGDNELMLSGLAQGLQDIKKGEKRRICLSAEEAYGFYDPKKVISYPRHEIPQHESLRPGAPVVILSKEGERKTYRVTQVNGDMVTLDANHPLAGQDLVFEIEAVAARDATPEEIMESSAEVTTQFLH